MIDKKTLIVGATPNTSRYAFAAANMLNERRYDFVPIGIKKGEVFGKAILDIKQKPRVENVHTITMYIGPRHQPEWYEYLLSLSPQRVIFNPGTENFEFQRILKENGVRVEMACTLVMLSTGQY